jgi:hypothetical protein
VEVVQLLEVVHTTLTLRHLAAAVEITDIYA